MILITRPEQKLAKSVQAFRRAGIDVTGCALVTIQPAEGLIAACRQQLLDTPPAAVIVTSAFAVAALPPSTEIRSDIHCFAVGNTTAAALISAGFNAISPNPQTSEGLLALPQLKDAKSQQIVIIKGERGRTTLQDALQLQGNQVSVFNVYRRQVLDKPVLTDNWQWPQIEGIVATSVEMAELLFHHYDQARLRGTRWLTVSDRIASRLHELGVNQTAVCSDASDSALCAWIKENWE